MKHLHYLVAADKSHDLEVLSKSSLASIRLRSVPSIRAAYALSWKVSFGEEVKGAPSVVLVGKIGANNIDIRQNIWMGQILRAKKCAQIFLDYTDHHLGFDSSMSPFYKSVIKEVDGCIVPSQSMAALLSSSWNGSISIIEDPLEINAFPPKAHTSKPVTLLWFGHSSNIDFLIHFLSVGFNSGDHIRLIVLSNEVGLNHFANSHLVSSAKIEFNLALWSLDNMVEAAKIADMCIIPSDLNNPSKIGASPNRLITALTLGLPTAADNLPSYQEFKGYYCDLRGDGFREMLKNPAKFSSIVTQAQADLMPRFSMNQIEVSWKNFFLNSAS